MTKTERALHIISALKTEYPVAECSLRYEKPYQLLFAVRLAAQCTDERVNMVTPRLFSEFPTLESFAAADIRRIGEIVRSCGFYNSKARDIVLCANKLINDFSGIVPDNMEDLVSLPGVGRKTANLILGDVYHRSAYVVDTHCIRLSNRMGLTESYAPEKIERDLRDIIPPEESSDFCHRLVMHGRAVCMARKPSCGRCCVVNFCGKIGL